MAFHSIKAIMKRSTLENNENDRGKPINPVKFGCYRTYRCRDINVRDMT